MNIFLIGVSHHQSPVEVRERLAALNADDPELDYCGDDSLRESLLISTCNRLEILGATDSPRVAGQALTHFLAKAARMRPEDLAPHLYIYHGLPAVRHLFRVAASLDSLVLGEAQILGQVKAAFRQALKRRTTGPVIGKLMHKCFRAAKRVRAETMLAGGAVSVASAAARLAKKIMGDLADREVLLLGAGNMAGLAAAHLKKQGGRIVVCSRTFSRAQALAAGQKLLAAPLEDLAARLEQADLVVAATGAGEPVLTSQMLGPRLPARGNRPLLVMDIGVPRNVSEEVAALPGVTLKNIDDLEEVVAVGRGSRKSEAAKAEAIVDEEVAKFAKWYESRGSWPTIAALTGKAETARKVELARTLAQHQFNPDQKAALEIMTRSLVRRLLHDPLTFLKGHGHFEKPGQPGDSADNRLDLLRRVFKLDD